MRCGRTRAGWPLCGTTALSRVPGWGLSKPFLEKTRQEVSSALRTTWSLLRNLSLLIQRRRNWQHRSRQCVVIGTEVSLLHLALGCTLPKPVLGQKTGPLPAGSGPGLDHRHPTVTHLSLGHTPPSRVPGAGERGWSVHPPVSRLTTVT